jgi:hypothetical protein
MANPTTNYGFVLPTSSDLVTDLPADFDVALQGVDTRLKALNPATTLGDLTYASATANTNTRLAVGSTGNVLTVAGGVPTWAAPSGAGLSWTLLNAGGTLLSGSSVSITGISGKEKIMVQIQNAVNPAFARVFVRVNTLSSGYDYSTVTGEPRASYWMGIISSRGDFGEVGIYMGVQGNPAVRVTGAVTIDGCSTNGNKSFASLGSGEGSSGVGEHEARSSQGIITATAPVTSIQVHTSSGSFSGGRVYVYGA